MLIIRRLKPEQLHLIHPLEDPVLLEEEALLRIGRSGLQLSYTPLPRPQWHHIPPVAYAGPEFLINDPDSAFYTAFDGDAYIGCAAVTIAPSGWAEILDLRVQASNRRQGIGRLLLEKCIAFSEKHELTGIRISCTDSNAVMCHFLESNGFTLHGYDQMILSQQPSERCKPRSKRASLLYFYRLNQKG